ncbi:MAG: glycosyltransferase family 2 protein [Polyangiaceae bacterium]
MSLHGKQVAVVVPAYCEERFIVGVLVSMPSWVDHVIVVDDASPDGTADRVRSHGDPRVRLLVHGSNLGVGAAIASGYHAALSLGAEAVAVMAGDGQMDPADLRAVLDPVVGGQCDYVKGNRFLHSDRRRMPALRRLGSAALSRLTRGLTGLDVDDTQCGYTAIGARALRSIPLDDLWPRYGYPNDLLGMLAARRLRVTDVAVRPVYAEEASGLTPLHPPLIAFVALRRFVLERRRRALGPAA